MPRAERNLHGCDLGAADAERRCGQRRHHPEERDDGRGSQRSRHSDVFGTSAESLEPLGRTRPAVAMERSGSREPLQPVYPWTGRKTSAKPTFQTYAETQLSPPARPANLRPDL